MERVRWETWRVSSGSLIGMWYTKGQAVGGAVQSLAQYERCWSPSNVPKLNRTCSRTRNKLLLGNIIYVHGRTIKANTLFHLTQVILWLCKLYQSVPSNSHSLLWHVGATSWYKADRASQMWDVMSQLQLPYMYMIYQRLSDSRWCTKPRLVRAPTGLSQSSTMY